MGWWLSCNVPGNTLARYLWGSPTHPCFSVFLCVCRDQIFVTQPKKTNCLRCNEGTIHALFWNCNPNQKCYPLLTLSEESSSLLAPRLVNENHWSVLPNALQELFPVCCAMTSAEKNNLPSPNHPCSQSGRLSPHHHGLLVIRDHFGGLPSWRLNPQEDLDLEKFLLLCPSFNIND